MVHFFPFLSEKSLQFLQPFLIPPSFLGSSLLPIPHTATESCSALGDFTFLPCSYHIFLWNYWFDSNFSSCRAYMFLPSFVSSVLFATPKFKSLFHFHLSMPVSFVLSSLPPIANVSHSPPAMLQQPVPVSLLPAVRACYRCFQQLPSLINSGSCVSSAHIAMDMAISHHVSAVSTITHPTNFYLCCKSPLTGMKCREM